MIISGIICALFCGNFLLCYAKSKGQYDDYLEAVDKKEYGLKDFYLWVCGLMNRDLKVSFCQNH